MNKTRPLAGVAGLLIAGAVWAGVVVRESVVTNLLGESSFRSGRIGAPPPKPWQCSKSLEHIRVILETPTGRPETERWVRLVDDSDRENANIRQTFAAVTNGQFQARVIANKDGGRLFFHLGSGAASKPEERAVQLILESDGSLVARGVQKPKTTMRIKASQVYLVRCDFERINEGRALRVAAELIEEGTQQQGRVETEVETQLAITAMRVTSVGPDTGVDYYVTDLSLVGR